MSRHQAMFAVNFTCLVGVIFITLSIGRIKTYLEACDCE
jgi:predicted ABC-type exoprotein transport system permease subunit